MSLHHNIECSLPNWSTAGQAQAIVQSINLVMHQRRKALFTCSAYSSGILLADPGTSAAAKQLYLCTSAAWQLLEQQRERRGGIHCMLLFYQFVHSLFKITLHLFNNCLC